MSLFPLKATHAPVKAYYSALSRFHDHGHTTEGNTRSAFADLLKRCCGPYDWHLVEEYQFKGTNKQPLRADGALVDELTLVHGLWEAKDTTDDLAKEIKSKVAKGYPLTNILFQSPTRAVLYQDNRIAFDDAIDSPDKLIEVLELFFNYHDPNIPDWEDAVTKFAEKIPDLARGVTSNLEAEDKKNPAFRENFQSFAELCRQSINPDLTDDAIRKMLVQHLLTERIFRRIFNNQEFLSRNVIAAEIEKVIHSITATHFSRDTFLKPLDHFYTSIEKAAESQQGYTEKQHFLNAVYEKFFQQFDTKQADTHGIVYTPQPIVDFMVRSVDEILQQEFGKTLSDKGVHILDPFTGTGNFITRVMQQIKRSALPQKYAEELHCNEIMLLPYYIASMNIEHAYMERLRRGDELGEYRSFEGICLVDTFDLADAPQGTLFTTENSARVKRQRSSPITVIIGNPPYNVGQIDENDDNPNRRHRALDARVADTFRANSKASSTTKLGNMYVRAFRWAADRLEDDGVVAFVTNNGFLRKRVFDGMRRCLAEEFTTILVLDLGGDVRENPKLSGTTHNVFGIKPGVCITFLVKSGARAENSVRYARVDEYWRKGQKLAFLDERKTINEISWESIAPTPDATWLDQNVVNGYDGYVPLCANGRGIFKIHSMGANTNRDRWTISFQLADLKKHVGSLLSTYNSDRTRYIATTEKKSFRWTNDKKKIKWSSSLKGFLKRNLEGILVDQDARITAHRPFTTEFIYFNKLLTHRRGKLLKFFPAKVSAENRLICVPGPGNRKSFGVFAVNGIPSLDLAFEKVQCFAFYRYGKPQNTQYENISASTRTEFRTHYTDQSITKWDIFHATYAVLHHPEYRTRYAANLKRELPRIPFPPDFHAFAAAGKRLMELHIDYEKQPEYPLEEIEDPKAEVSFRVTRMKLSKDKSELRYNDFLLLRGIPPAAFDYRLGNRSALDWVIDQYRVSTDARSGIVNDPNRPDDPTYILRLIKQVITVSIETQQIIAALPSLELGGE